MPGMLIFGRKWMVGSDDLVLPGFFDLIVRFVWLVLVAIVFVKHYSHTDCPGGNFIRAYLIGMLVILLIVIVNTTLLIQHSMRGTIGDSAPRHFVPLLLKMKLILMIPETAWNIMGALWAFSTIIQCDNEVFTGTIIEGLVIFNWVLFALTVLGIGLVFDPVGSAKYYVDGDDNLSLTQEINQQAHHHYKNVNLWMRRFRWFCCCLGSDKHSKQAFHDVANLFTALFRGTDIVPSDVAAGFVLLRIKHKKERREIRRLRMQYELHLRFAQRNPENKLQHGGRPQTLLPEVPVRCEVDQTSTTPWMTVENAYYYFKFSLASYGWPFFFYANFWTCLCKLWDHMTCCSCIRSKPTMLSEDNCCLCNLASMKRITNLAAEDILYASFRNRVFEVPFFVAVDHNSTSIVLAIRGSMSMRDVFTDFTAGAEPFQVEGLPPETSAHKGMIQVARFVKNKLDEVGILAKAFAMYPEYHFVVSGHSLGAGVATLLSLMLRPTYPKIRCFAYSPPGGLLSREAAIITEEFTFALVLGDDLVARLGVDTIENLRTRVLTVIQSCPQPKYRILVTGCGYAFFGVPSKDLESACTTANPSPAAERPLMIGTPSSYESFVLEKNVAARRYSSVRLYPPGKILHVDRRKDELSRLRRGKKYEARWTPVEFFDEILVSPRMMTDHFPDHLYGALASLLEEEDEEIVVDASMS